MRRKQRYESAEIQSMSQPTEKVEIKQHFLFLILEYRKH
jgi:hypothetical protein